MAQDALQTIVGRIVERFDPERIYLFGSRARGQGDAGSDFDILVVADMPGVPARKRAFHVRSLFPLREFGLDVIVKTPDEFERGRRILNHICCIVSREGKVAYERRH